MADELTSLERLERRLLSLLRDRRALGAKWTVHCVKLDDGGYSAEISLKLVLPGEHHPREDQFASEAEKLVRWTMR